MNQESFDTYARHGHAPFFRLPVVDPTKLGAEIYAGCDVALLGIPFDGGTTYRSGARLAPYHVRRVSALVTPFHPTHGIDVFAALRVLDCGNIVAPPFNAAAMREIVQSEVAQMLAHDCLPMLVGGDHSVTLPSLRALAAKHGPVAVVHVDAHFDISTADPWGEPYHHGTPIRNAIEEGVIAEGHLYQVGLRGPWKSDGEPRLLDDFGATRWTADEVETVGPGAIAGRIRERVGDRPVYLTIDIDALDPAFAPGTGTPVPGGMTAREVLALVRGLAGVRLCGADVVEITPMLDHADVTCLLGAYLLFEALALAAIARV
jgi:agmatinase